jgi:hypothetical protein
LGEAAIVEYEVGAQCVREAKIMRLIITAFCKLGLDVADVFYQEDCDREAAVTLDDDTVDLHQLCQLETSGLAHSYRVWGTCHELHVVFRVCPELDDAVDG